MKKLLVFLLIISAEIHADLYELKYPSESRFLKNHWVPALEIDGWHQDRQHTLMYQSNVLVPDGFSYLTTSSWISAFAKDNERFPELKSISDFIGFYFEESREPNIEISEVDSIYTEDGKKLKSYTVFPLPPTQVFHAKDGLWQRVSFGEEGEFYIVFILSGRTEEAYKSALPTYLKSLEDYSEKP